MRRLLVILVSIALAACTAEAASKRPKTRARTSTFTANAYCRSGRTRAGQRPKTGTVAADPHILPLGSKVRIEGVKAVRGGVYTVTDTGGGVKGRRLDIYMPSCRAARQFGVRRVRVALVRRGWGSDGAAVGEQ